MSQSATEEIHFQVLRLLERRPELTQRKLANALGVWNRIHGGASVRVAAVIEWILQVLTYNWSVQA
jgi:hypothetical protein